MLLKLLMLLIIAEKVLMYYWEEYLLIECKFDSRLHLFLKKLDENCLFKQEYQFAGFLKRSNFAEIFLYVSTKCILTI